MESRYIWWNTTVQAKVKGKKVVTLASNLSEQTASFSTNPAFCLLDYLRNERYGKGIATSSIDLQSFYDASQVCSNTSNTIFRCK